ncbi:MAG TPA: GNAT family N-acetyltransferase [Clostridia bacterium]|nr:GNAT family N-acetyltransferase [Clostridia bacterium]
MTYTIRKGTLENFKSCTTALINSELGKQYFHCWEKAESALVEGFEKEEIYVALNEDNTCLGFIWFIFKGAFHSYPYLHIIAVREEYRRMGIGKGLLKFFEDQVFKAADKAFLVVADFNPEAKKLYVSLGYKQVGEIPGLYKNGVTEYIMMKERS